MAVAARRLQHVAAARMSRILTSSLRNGFAVIAGGACEASVSKDGPNARTRGHPSRRAHRTAQVRCREGALLRMRSEINSQARTPGRQMFLCDASRSFRDILAANLNARIPKQHPRNIFRGARH